MGEYQDPNAEPKEHPHGGAPGQTGANPGQTGAPPPGQAKKGSLTGETQRSTNIPGGPVSGRIACPGGVPTLLCRPTRRPP